MYVQPNWCPPVPDGLQLVRVADHHLDPEGELGLLQIEVQTGNLGLAHVFRHGCKTFMYMYVIYICMLYTCTCNYFVGSCGPTHPSHPMISSISFEIPYSGYFSGGKIFVVFMVDRRNTKYLPTKPVPQSTRVWFSIPHPRKFFHEQTKNSLIMKILPPEKYPLYSIDLANFGC